MIRRSGKLGQSRQSSRTIRDQGTYSSRTIQDRGAIAYHQITALIISDSAKKKKRKKGDMRNSRHMESYCRFNHLKRKSTKLSHSRVYSRSSAGLQKAI
jgi:hypothetical protein